MPHSTQKNIISEMFFPANLLAQYWKNQTQQNYSLLHEKAASMLHYCMLWEKALVWTDEPTNRLLKCNNNEAECTDTWQTNWYIGNEAPRLIIAHYYGYHNAAHTLIMLFTDEVLFRQSSAAEMGNVDFIQLWFLGNYGCALGTRNLRRCMSLSSKATKLGFQLVYVYIVL